MHVDFVTPYYRPVVGGIEDHVASLAQAAIKRGWKVTVHTQDRDLSGRKLPERGRDGDVQIRRYRAKYRFGYYARRFEPKPEGDAAHLHGYGLWTNAWFTRQYPDRPYVLTLHHGIRIPTKSPLHWLLHALHRQAGGRRTLRRARAVVAINPLDVDRALSMGVAKDRVRWIPNGVPRSGFETTKPAKPPRTWRSYFLYLGRIHREKDLEHAIHAAVGLDRQLTGILVAGPDQGHQNKLQAWVKRNGFEDRVEFLGRVDDQRKRELLAGCIALVLPSRYEAQGRVLVEAWAQKRPVIAARVGGVPEVVEDGKDGILYSWGNIAQLEVAMRRFLENSKEAAAMGSAGHGKARTQFAEEDLVAATLDLLETAATKGT